MEKKQNILEILHFNDVYEIDELKTAVKIEKSRKKTKAGASRFVTAMKQAGCEDPNKLVLFCGDLLAPSLLS